MHRRLFLPLLFALATPGFASESPEPLRALKTQITCRAEAHPETRRIFNCSDRILVLAPLGVHREDLAELFTGMQEHEMVKLAIGKAVGVEGFSPLQRAIYWEELAAVIHSAIGHPVSQSFRGIHEGSEIYIFQGTKRFEEKAYVLAFLASGHIYSGLADPIEKIGEWVGRLDELKLIN